MVDDFATQLCKLNADCMSQYGSRSSKRIDVIHTCLKEAIERMNPALTCKLEYNFTIETGTYACDLVVFHGETLVACISTKASMSNIKQNKTNMENVKLGELLKLRDAVAPTVKIAFFDVLPADCPYYDAHGNVKHIEHIDIAKTKEQQRALVRLCEKQGIPMHLFSLFANYTYHAKNHVCLDTIANQEDMEAFAEFIRTLAPL
jgi:hypothetical protein